MDNQLLQNLKSSIEKSDQIAIAVGQNPSVDQMAGALSVYLTLQTAGKKVAIVSASEPIVEISNLVGIDRVKTTYSSDTGDLVVSFPYNEGEIEKVSYTMDDNFLNIVVKAGENGLTFNEADVRYTRGATAPNILFVIGTQSMNDLNSIFSAELLDGVTTVNIDNHADNQGFGDIVLVSPRFSSLSEQVADLLLTLGYEFDVDVAQNLMSGITQATNNFQNPNTTYLAFEIAAILMKKGAVRQASNRLSQDREQMSSNRPQMNQPRPQSQQNRGNQQNQPRQGGQQNQSRGGNQQNASRPQMNQPRPQSQPQQMQQSPSQQAQPESQVMRDEPMFEESTHEAKPQEQTQKPPADWLTPKVYKGSSEI
jgi:nanoRNase/pAp phosphatase (c-di-AMP/oligoRNAs hydrolase)